MLRKLLMLLVVLAGLSAAAAAVFYQQWRQTPVYTGDAPLTFEVMKGDSMRGVAARLAERTGYAYPQLLSFYAQQQGQAGQLKAGEFALQPGLLPDDFLDVLIAGKVVSYPLTIIEGWTFAQMREAVSQHPQLTHTLTDNDSVMQALGYPDLHPEGRFYPDTYFVTKGQTDVDVYRQSFSRMSERLDEIWQQRDDDVPLDNAYEALILASIIEKETGAADERRHIAGVFTRRLKRGMRLQTDPTVIYGVGEAYRGDITRKHLTTDTPYNTYTRHGLPPTPIALPGEGALRAAVSPLAGDALYFVATGEGDGRHYFSATLEEHNRAVQRYLARLRQRAD